jgi:hypothetical protein
MAPSSRAQPKWIDLDPPPAPVAIAVADDVEFARYLDIDRYHNGEKLSPEVMAKAISELQDRVAALEEGSGGAVAATKRLGLDMLEMGDVLSKRMRALEVRPEPEPAETAPAEAAPEAVAEAQAPLFVKPAGRTRASRAAPILVGVMAVAMAVAGVAILDPALVTTVTALIGVH